MEKHKKYKFRTGFSKLKNVVVNDTRYPQKTMKNISGLLLKMFTVLSENAFNRLDIFIGHLV